MPVLRTAIIEQSCRFASGAADFGDMLSSVWAVASRYGAGYLPPEHQDALHGWLCIAIVAEIEAVERIDEEADQLVADLLLEPSRNALRERVRAFINAG